MSDILVKISSIKGESNLAGYAEQIECVSMRHTIDLPVVADNATRTEGASMHGAVELMHAVDRASPLLRAEALAGTNLNEVVITRMGQIEGETKPVETITLSNVYVVRVDLDAPVDLATMLPVDEPQETFALEYSQIVWNFESGNSRGGWSTSTLAKV